MPLFNLSAYWILWSLYLVAYYTANMQCQGFIQLYSKNCLYSFPKINLLSLLYNQNFLTCQNKFFRKSFFPILEDGMEMSWYHQSAGSKSNNKSSKHDRMTAEFCKKNYQKTYLSDFRLGILVNKKVLEKSRIGWRQMLVPRLPSRNNFVVIAVKNYTK